MGVPASPLARTGDVTVPHGTTSMGVPAGVVSPPGAPQRASDSPSPPTATRAVNRGARGGDAETRRGATGGEELCRAPKKSELKWSFPRFRTTGWGSRLYLRTGWMGGPASTYVPIGWGVPRGPAATYVAVGWGLPLYLRTYVPTGWMGGPASAYVPVGWGVPPQAGGRAKPFPRQKSTPRYHFTVWAVSTPGLLPVTGSVSFSM